MSYQSKDNLELLSPYRKTLKNLYHVFDDGSKNPNTRYTYVGVFGVEVYFCQGIKNIFLRDLFYILMISLTFAILITAGFCPPPENQLRVFVPVARYSGVLSSGVLPTGVLSAIHYTEH